MQVFLVNDQFEEKVTFMTVTKSFYYEEISVGSTCDALKMIELPYEGNSSMFILLPPKSCKVNAVIASQSIYELVKKFQERKTEKMVELHMPKFKFNTKIQMQDILIKMGITDIFSTSSANLSGISESQRLYVSSILHATAIEVNEQGTKAAAVTSISIGIESLMPPPANLIELILDHLFLFLIYEHVANLPLFVGKLSKPQF